VDAGEYQAAMPASGVLRWAVAALTARQDSTARRRIGRMALRAKTISAGERVRMVAQRLPSSQWPDAPLRIPAVDAATGELRVFDRSGSVSLADAVAASSAAPLVWPAITISGRSYIDGMVRSPTNLDLAAGHSLVVVLAPVTRAARKSGRIDRQLASLPSGTQALVIEPGKTSREAIGGNVFDTARRPGAARAGLMQADEIADRVRKFWEGVSELPDCGGFYIGRDARQQGADHRCRLGVDFALGRLASGEAA
jgi:NTE family protein